MSVQTDYSPNFGSDAFQDFLVSDDRTFEDAEATNDLLRKGFVKLDSETVGQLELPQDESEKNLQIWSGELRRYAIYKGRTNVGSIEVTIPIKHVLGIDIRSDLLARDKMSDEDKTTIQTEYRNFLAQGGDPVEFAVDQQRQHGIAAGDYEVVIYSRIERLNFRGEPDLTQEKFLRNSLEQAEQGHRLVLLERLPVKQLPTPDPDDSLRDVSDESEIPGVIDELTNQHREYSACDLVDRTPPHRVGTLYQFPEFRIKWVRMVTKVGCVRIVYHWPRLQTRTTKKVLYVVTIFEQLPAVVKKIVERCVRDSATNPVVIVTALFHIVAALSILLALVEQCIFRKLDELLDCIFPELIVKTEKGGWSNV